MSPIENSQEDEACETILKLLPYKTDYRVIGNTGLVWGLRSEMLISKTTGTGRNRFFKTSVVYTKSESKWPAVMMHSTLISEYKFE